MKSLVLTLLLIAGTSFAAKKPTKPKTPVVPPNPLSSFFTDMQKDCKPGAQSNTRTCKGPKGYTIEEATHGMDYSCLVANDGDRVTNPLLPITDCGHGVYGSKMEWRLKNGTPFALVYRITCYQQNIASRNPGNTAGEFMVIQPLTEAGPADEFDAVGTPSADSVARDKADGLAR